jgi:hypothetical protein
MTELPEHVKAQADAEVAATGARKMPVQDMGAQNVADWKDAAAMEAAREQQRQNALQEKATMPDPHEPDKG